MSVYCKAKETLDWLSAKSEWVGRYKEYAEKIDTYKKTVESKEEKRNNKGFHKWSPLYVYLTTSEMKARESVSFSLRYVGQEVGKIIVTAKGEIKCRPLHDNNSKYFDGYAEFLEEHKIGKEFAWNSEEAREFRKCFSLKKPFRKDENGKKNNEHKYESMLLTYFEESEKKFDAFKHIRPVSIIPGVRFPMPTPISASNHKKITYSGQYGGGIDIFTRTGNGKATYLNVMELKDENVKGEEPSVVIGQAVAYATFILKLLRSESGNEWYKLFGFSSDLPETIKVYATCLMPKGECEDKTFANKKIYVHNKLDEVYDTEQDNCDIIELHYMYFEENDGKVLNVETSLNNSNKN